MVKSIKSDSKASKPKQKPRKCPFCQEPIPQDEYTSSMKALFEHEKAKHEKEFLEQQRKISAARWGKREDDKSKGQKTTEITDTTVKKSPETPAPENKTPPQTTTEKPEEVLAKTTGKGREGKGDGSNPTVILAEANIFAFTPKKLEFSSTLLYQAKVVCENEWSWPVMSLGDWLDTYLYETMKQRGIVLGGYMKIPIKQREDKGNGGT